MKNKILILLLMIPPILVAVIETFSRDFPEKEKFFGKPINLIWDVMIPSSVGPTIMLGFLGVLSLFLISSKQYAQLESSSKKKVLASLKGVTIILLWFGIFWAYFNVFDLWCSYWDSLFGCWPFEMNWWLILFGIMWSLEISRTLTIFAQYYNNSTQELTE